ncbi:hypothetical protein QTP70_032513, partial [Hemibagrus guttatus]
YRPGIGVDDAVIYLPHRVLTHLESAGSTLRVIFFDFSSDFNTIQPALLCGKLERSGMDVHLAAWTINYLTNRPQYKFSDDSAIVGCVCDGNEQEYRDVIKDFADWCECNHLHLNTSKTKEMVIDFQRRRTPHHTPVTIQGLDIEFVDSFKYLGVHLNNRLDWLDNTHALYKKGQSRLHLLRRLGSFGVCRTLLRTFYDTVVVSAILYAIVCWLGGSTQWNRKRLNKLVRRASCVLGCPLDLVEEVGERRMLAKLRFIMNNTSHLLYGTVEILCSSFSSRLLHPQCRKEHHH